MTIADVAAALGVSKTAVSRAMTGNGRVSPETKARILEYVERHNFKPNIIAKSLANLKTYNIAFTIPNHQEFSEIPFFQKCLVGVCEKASEGGYDVVVATVDDRDISEMRRIVENRKVDGVILSRNVDNDGIISYLRGSDIPFVLIGTTDNPEVVQVDNDHEAACAEITTLFMKNGEGAVGLIGGNHSHVVNTNRYNGFQAAAPKQRVIWDAVDDASITKAFEELYADGVRTVFCMDDMICGHLLQRLHVLNIEVPRDVRLVSYYSNWYLSSYMSPIPSLHFDASEQGETACGLLLKLLSGEPVPQRTLKGHRLLNCDLDPVHTGIG